MTINFTLGLDLCCKSVMGGRGEVIMIWRSRSWSSGNRTLFIEVFQFILELALNNYYTAVSKILEEVMNLAGPYKPG